MANLEVGKKYPGKILGEGVMLDYNNGFTLYVFLPNITPTEAIAFKKGRYKFALAEVDNVLYFLSELKGAIDVSDSPFHFGLYKDNRAEQLPKDVGTNEGIALNIIVVDSSTGILKVLRLIGLQHDFSVALINKCLEQSKQELNVQECNRSVACTQISHSAKDIYRKAFIECEG